MSLPTVTRQEKYLAYLNGDTSVVLPKPVTNVDYYLYNLCMKGGTGGGGVSVQSDYSQNDSTQPDYIKNRPFYSEMGEGEILPETTFEAVNKSTILPYIPLIVGAKYTVKWNGTEYQCEGQLYVVEEASLEGVALGNIGLITGGEQTTEPFILASADVDGVKGLNAIPLDGSSNVTLSINGPMEIVHEIDEKYAPSSIKVVLFEKLASNENYQCGYVFDAVKMWLLEEKRLLVAKVEVIDGVLFLYPAGVSDTYALFSGFYANDAGVYYTTLEYIGDDYWKLTSVMK